MTEFTEPTATDLALRAQCFNFGWCAGLGSCTAKNEPDGTTLFAHTMNYLFSDKSVACTVTLIFSLNDEGEALAPEGSVGLSYAHELDHGFTRQLACRLMEAATTLETAVSRFNAVYPQIPVALP